MSDMPLVSVVILSWNRIDDLRFTLETVERDPYPRLEIIVVDNASTDGTPAMVRGEFPDVRLIELPRNIGIAGWNAGFEVARGRYILVLDDDSYPQTGVISEGTKLMDNDPKCGVVAYNIFNLRNRYHETSYLTKLNPVTEFIGCGALIRKEAVQEAGAYNKQLFLYLHEIDFSIRLHDCGYHIIYAEHLLVYHQSSTKNRSIVNSRDCRGVYYYNRNILYILFLYFPLRITLFRHIRITIGRLIGSLNSGCFQAGVRGLFSAYILMINNRGHRDIVQTSVQELFKNGGFAGGIFFEHHHYRFKRPTWLRK